MKNHNLELNGLKNCCPVSNHPYLSKWSEKTVAQQLDEHFESNNLQSLMQSAHRKHHFAEGLD